MFNECCPTVDRDAIAACVAEAPIEVQIALPPGAACSTQGVISMARSGMADGAMWRRRGSEPAFAATAPGLAPLCRALTVAGDEEGLVPLDVAAIASALNRFGRSFREPEPRPLASLWSMYYFNAVVVPAAAAALILDRALPLALERCRLRLDADGTPAEVRLGRAPPRVDGGSRDALCGTSGDATGNAFGVLAEHHLAPFVALYSAATGVAPRLLWSNAAVTLAFALDRVAAAALPGPRSAAMALLDGRHEFPHLAGAFREDELGERERLLCCGRRRLGGVAPCYTLCPERRVW